MSISHNVYVRSVNGSSKEWPYPKCSCSTWIAHWRNNYLYSTPSECPICGRTPDSNNPWVGGHVQKVRKNENGDYVLTDDQTIFIVPICDCCNKSGSIVFRVDKRYLVPMAADECRIFS